MSRASARRLDTAQDLRRRFDRSFAEASCVETAPFEDLLGLRVGGHPFAVRLNEIAGLFADRKITPLPGPFPALLGIAGFRGVIVPVYDLRTLLGYAGAGTPRWLVLVAAETTVGLAFDQFEGHIRLPRAALAPDPHGVTNIRELAPTPEGPRPVIHVPSIVETIKRRADSVGQKEQ